MDVALEERFLAAGGEHAVHRPARGRHAQTEQEQRQVDRPLQRADERRRASSSRALSWVTGPAPDARRIAASHLRTPHHGAIEVDVRRGQRRERLKVRHAAQRARRVRQFRVERRQSGSVRPAIRQQRSSAGTSAWAMFVHQQRFADNTSRAAPAVSRRDCLITPNRAFSRHGAMVGW